MKTTTLSFLLCLITTAFASAGQTAQTLQKTVKKDIAIQYWLYLPDGYKADDAKQWPLMIFLHGAGERGNDLDLVKKHGPPKLAAAGKSFPFIIASPQCPADQWWDIDALDLLLETLMSDHRVDPDRVYLTGLSMGGYGTWELATKYPDKFAAIAPICGGGSARRASRQLEKMPIWVFHGAKDSVVPLKESQDIVDALKKRGGKSVKFTIYPEANHDSWTETYNNPALYEWFLSHSRQE